MINSAKLRGRIVEKETTIQELASKIPCTGYTLGQKIANETPMQIEEAATLIRELDIPNNEIIDYFFYNNGCKNATE